MLFCMLNAKCPVVFVLHKLDFQTVDRAETSSDTMQIDAVIVLTLFEKVLVLFWRGGGELVQSRADALGIRWAI